MKIISFKSVFSMISNHLSRLSGLRWMTKESVSLGALFLLFMLSVVVATARAYADSENLLTTTAACKIDLKIPQLNYMVPVDDNRDHDVNFPMQNVVYQRCSRDIVVSYELPENLVGQKTVIVLSGKSGGQAGKVQLAGPQGHAECQQINSLNAICNIKYQNLQINQKRALELLKKENLSSGQLKMKMLAMTSFDGNPVGIFYLPNSLFHRMKAEYQPRR